MELPFEKRTNLVAFLILAIVLLAIIPLFYNSSQAHSSIWQTPSSSSFSSPSFSADNSTINPIKTLARTSRTCDIFSGEWVPNPIAPYYTNETCWAIHEHQNCMKYGRPDTEFMKWRWKPQDCELPIFNAAQFLELMRGKSMAFVGDSVARNHMQSLMCLLNRVTYPVDVSLTTDEKFKRWKYSSHSCTLAHFTSPFLVKGRESGLAGPTNTGLFKLYLDEPDTWGAEVSGFDYIIISAGQWFLRPMMFYENKRLIGCHFCLDPNTPDLTKYYGYRAAFRTAFRALNNMTDFKGVVFLRTFAPSHFENGEWNKRGDCVRKKPQMSNETRLEGINLEMYMIQIEEFRSARREGMKKGLKYELMDTTEAMLMRPDGHPSKYGHLPNENVSLYNDCVHWCLPGPIDTWNDFLLHMLVKERRSGSGRFL